MSSNPDVLIVGAGPTGLALAYDLHRRGNHSIRIVDKNPHTSEHSKALGVHARTMELLDIMGLGEKFLKEGCEMKQICVHFGKKTAEFQFLDIDSPHHAVLSIPQNISEKILENNLGLQVEWNTEVIACESGEYTLKKGGEIEKIFPKWVVGCDGARSFMRQSNNISFEGKSSTPRFYMLDAEGDFEQDAEKYHVFLSTKEPAVLAFPMTKTRWRLISLNPEQFKQFKIREIHWESVFTINSRHVAKLHEKNFFLCGDAAHIHSPVGGQGMNTSIQDGYNLSWKLDLVLKGAAPLSLLDSYEKERMPVIRGLVKFTRRATFFLLFAPRPIRLVIYRLLCLVLNTRILNKRLATIASQIAIHYKYSPIVRDEYPNARGPKAGERLPDAILHDDSHVYDLLRNTTKHTLLLMQENQELISYIREYYGEWIDVKVICGDLMKLKYKAGPESIYLIRPDGYIGYRSTRLHLDKFKDYLKELFLTTV